MSERG